MIKQSFTKDKEIKKEQANHVINLEKERKEQT